VEDEELVDGDCVLLFIVLVEEACEELE